MYQHFEYLFTRLSNLLYQHFEYLSFKPNICIFGLKALYSIAQGNALGFCLYVSTRPVRAKVHILGVNGLCTFALTGRWLVSRCTQGVALGYVVLGFQPVPWAMECRALAFPSAADFQFSPLYHHSFLFFLGTSNWTAYYLSMPL